MCFREVDTTLRGHDSRFETTTQLNMTKMPKRSRPKRTTLVVDYLDSGLSTAHIVNNVSVSLFLVAFSELTSAVKLIADSTQVFVFGLVFLNSHLWLANRRSAKRPLVMD